MKSELMPIIELDKIKSSHFLKETNHVIEFCEPLFKYFGINYFDYARFYPDNTCISYFTDPDYVLTFSKDDTYQPPTNFLKPGKYLWQGYLPSSILKIASDQFNHFHGITIVKDKACHAEVFNFSAPENKREILDLYLNHFELLELFMKRFLDSFEKQIKKNYSNRILLPQHKFYKQANLEISDRHFMQYLTELTKKKSRKNQTQVLLENTVIPVSFRELSCLKLLTEGKAIKHIAKELNISYRTVEIYCANIYRKTNSANRIELLTKINHQGLFVLDASPL